MESLALLDGSSAPIDPSGDGFWSYSLNVPLWRCYRIATLLGLKDESIGGEKIMHLIDKKFVEQLEAVFFLG